MVILYKLAEQIIQTKNPNGTGQCPAEKPRLARSLRKMGRTLTCPLSLGAKVNKILKQSK